MWSSLKSYFRGSRVVVLQQENARRHFVHKHEILQPNGGSKEQSKECRGEDAGLVYVIKGFIKPCDL
jgi:hypothetical protein